MNDVVGWDVRHVVDGGPVLGERGRRRWAAPLDVLEVGAGPGGVSLWLALAGHRVTCTNYDYTVEQAQPLHERYGVADRIEYRDLDILDLPYEDRFDLVVFKSVLGGIPDSDLARHEAAIEQVRKVLKPGGRLIFAENLRGTLHPPAGPPDRLPGAARARCGSTSRCATTVSCSATSTESSCA